MIQTKNIMLNRQTMKVIKEKLAMIQKKLSKKIIKKMDCKKIPKKVIN